MALGKREDTVNWRRRNQIAWYCLDTVGTVYRLVIHMQSNKIHRVFQWVSLFSTYVSSTCFGPHRSIIRSVLEAVFANLVCGTTVRTARHVQPLRLDVSSSTRITTYQICEYSLYKTLLMMDQWGPKHVELTYVMNKLTHYNTLCILLECIYIN